LKFSGDNKSGGNKKKGGHPKKIQQRTWQLQRRARSHQWPYTVRGERETEGTVEEATDGGKAEWLHIEI
jgi:hypothetical protein